MSLVISWLSEALLVVALLALAGGALLAALRARRREREKQWSQRVAQSLLVALLNDEPCRFELPQGAVVGRKRLLAEVVAALRATVYGLNPEPLRALLLAEGVDRWLARQLRWAHGAKRALLLKLAADLPSMPRVVAEAVRHRRSTTRVVCFAVLLVEMAAEPAQILRLAASYAYPFTSVERGEVLALMRHSLLPIAYRPLFESGSENLERLAMALVAQFGIEEAEPYLQAILQRDDREAALRALCLLVQLHRPLPRRLVAPLLDQLTPCERRGLLRRLVHEGYSQRQIAPLFDGEERACYARMAATYKRTLAAALGR